MSRDHKGKSDPNSGLYRLLESLHFPDLLDRQAQVQTAHANTFNWILTIRQSEELPDPRFLAWTQSPVPLFWIHGKAGSGKSTLMRYVCENQITVQALKVWSEDSGLLIARYFFSNQSRNLLEKSVRGLLRSMLYQIFRNRPDLTKYAEPIDYQDLCLSESTLRNMLLKLLATRPEKDFFCFFIDALDEAEGDRTYLIELIHTISTMKNVKICVSSRRWRIFEDSFQSSPNIALHTFTKDDIKKYTSDKIKNVQRDFGSPTTDWDIARLAANIVESADGVFLWVDLAVRSLIEGLQNEDSYDTLWQRIKAMPSEIEDLFSHIFKSVHTVYKEEVARYLLIAAKAPRKITLADLMIATCHEDFNDMIREANSLIPDVNYIQHKFRKFKSRVLTRCLGLLEEGLPYSWNRWLCQDPSFEAYGLETVDLRGQLWQELGSYDVSVVRFLHRSISDYCYKNEQMLLDLANSSKQGELWSPHCTLALISIRRLAIILTDTDRPGETIASWLHEIFSHLREAERETGQSQPKYIIELSMILDRHSVRMPQAISERRTLFLSITQELYGVPYWITDILGVACVYGLYNYVFQNVNGENLDYVLLCLISGLGRVQRVYARPEGTLLGNALEAGLPYIRRLMAAGANPNHVFPPTQTFGRLGDSACPEVFFLGNVTAFKLLLRLIQESCEQRELTLTWSGFLLVKTCKIDWQHLQTVIDMISINGLDMDAMVCHEWMVWFSNVKDESSKIRIIRQYQIYLARDPVLLIGSCVGKAVSFGKTAGSLAAGQNPSNLKIACIFMLERKDDYMKKWTSDRKVKYTLDDESAAQCLRILQRTDREADEEPLLNQVESFLSSRPYTFDSPSYGSRSWPFDGMALQDATS